LPRRIPGCSRAQTREGERDLETLLDGITTAAGGSELEHQQAGVEG